MKRENPAAPASVDVLSVAHAPSLTAALDIIAQDQGFFTDQGLKVELIQVSNGSAAIQAMLSGKADVASSATYVVVLESFKRKDYKIFGSVATLGNDNQIVARKDSGISLLADLKGKRIGVSPNTMSQYSLDLLLTQAGLSEQDVILEYVDRAKLNDALISGDLDAICTMGAFVGQAKTALAENAVLFGNESLVQVTAYVTALDSTLQQKPQAIQKLLKGYIQAEEFIHNNPDQAIQILSTYYKMEFADTKNQWKTYRFRVGLDQVLIGDLEAIAQWQMQHKISEATQLPNFLDYFSYQGLEAIDNQRISIIH
jgi:ABC-type nitrate/sulfonate/bicarbonate transport system substrate-binding protein